MDLSTTGATPEHPTKTKIREYGVIRMLGDDTPHVFTVLLFSGVDPMDVRCGYCYDQNPACLMCPTERRKWMLLHALVYTETAEQAEAGLTDEELRAFFWSQVLRDRMGPIMLHLEDEQPRHPVIQRFYDFQTRMMDRFPPRPIATIALPTDDPRARDQIIQDVIRDVGVELRAAFPNEQITLIQRDADDPRRYQQETLL